MSCKRCENEIAKDKAEWPECFKCLICTTWVRPCLVSVGMCGLTFENEFIQAFTVDHSWPLSHIAQCSYFNCPGLKLKELKYEMYLSNLSREMEGVVLGKSFLNKCSEIKYLNKFWISESSAILNRIPLLSINFCTLFYFRWPRYQLCDSYMLTSIC